MTRFVRQIVHQTRRRQRALRPHASAMVASSLLSTVMPLAGCEHRASPPPHDPVGRETAFDVAYRHNCSGCHGRDGRVGPAPPLNDPLFLAWIPEPAFVRTVRDGQPGTPMPAFIQSRGGSLTGEEIVALVRGAKQRWGKPEQDFPSLPPYESPTTTKPSQARLETGGNLFTVVCAECHGDQGRGDIAGALHDSAFLSLISNQAVHRIVVAGRPDLGMPNYRQLGLRGGPGHPLRPDEIDDLVSFVTSWRTTQLLPPPQR